MSGTEELTVTLPRDLAERLRRSVAAGEYASVSEAVAAAIVLAEAEHAGVEPDVETLRRLVDEGLASGEPIEISIDEIKARARERMAEDRSGR